jgi:hypothetical protein
MINFGELPELLYSGHFRVGTKLRCVKDRSLEEGGDKLLYKENTVWEVKSGPYNTCIISLEGNPRRTLNGYDGCWVVDGLSTPIKDYL